MFRPSFIVLTALCAGCVEVTEPLGDIDKAEPDKNLIGSWAPEFDKLWVHVVDQPEVKGNPKGLMRLDVVPRKDPEKETEKRTLWFFVTHIGKHTYANILLGRAKNSGVAGFAQFDKEGTYAVWVKSDRRAYWVIRYNFEDDQLTTYEANEGVDKLFKANQIGHTGGNNGRGFDDFFQPPAGWLAKQLEKNDPDDLFSPNRTYNRLKK